MPGATAPGIVPRELCDRQLAWCSLTAPTVRGHLRGVSPRRGRTGSRSTLAGVEDEQVADRGLGANPRSYGAIALAVVAVFVLPVVTGPIALVVGILARQAGEPLARASLWAAGVGTFLGLVNLFAQIGG